ncbi:MAG TPA: hypothetical protein VGS21_08630, partial [Acidimicrobiales bacterium]|nr:hypothetical protein [Acidimicrobiales bacterium]
ISPNWYAGLARGQADTYSDLECPAIETCLVTARPSTDADGVFETSNGGRRWQGPTVRAAPLARSGITCWDALHCAIFVTAANVQSYLYRTADGGVSWKSLDGPRVLTLNGAENPVLSCPTSSRCILAANIQFGRRRQQSYIWVSNDGGSTWEQRTIDFYPAVATCSSATHCVVIGYDSAGKYEAATTFDWFGADTSTGRIAGPSGPYAFPDGVVCPTDLDCIASFASTPVGGGHTSEAVTRSTDGGRSWVETDTSSLPGTADVTYIACASASTCWLTGGPTPYASPPKSYLPPPGAPLLAETTDGGATWHPHAVPTGVQSIFGLSCPTPTTCYALGFATAAIQVHLYGSVYNNEHLVILLRMQ